jgi:hypothetical protein
MCARQRIEALIADVPAVRKGDGRRGAEAADKPVSLGAGNMVKGRAGDLLPVQVAAMLGQPSRSDDSSSVHAADAMPPSGISGNSDANDAAVDGGAEEAVDLPSVAGERTDYGLIIC